MSSKQSVGTRVLAIILSIVMVLGMVPVVPVSAENEYEAQIGQNAYETLSEALEAVPDNGTQTIITLLKDVTGSFDLGSEDGSLKKNVFLELDGYVLTLTDGISVQPSSALALRGGKVVCSDAVEVGVTNYGSLKLDGVELIAGAQTMYSINNRGALTLSGSTKIMDGSGSEFRFAITNNPYEQFYSNTDASVRCDSDGVVVESMYVERYERSTVNTGGVVIELSAGQFHSILEDGHSSVNATYRITGGVIGASTAEELRTALQIVSDGAEIRLYGDVALGFDVGAEDGSAVRNIKLNLNEKVLMMAPAAGTADAMSSGIRVFANSTLTLKNGTLVVPDAESGAEVKAGITNYGAVELESVKLKAGNATVYSINNRGCLVLGGSTVIEDGSGEQFRYAITNNPYGTGDQTWDASVHCVGNGVNIGNMQLERYERGTANAGSIVLDISGGSFGAIREDGGAAVAVTGKITGGNFAEDVSAYVLEGYECVALGNGRFAVQYIKQEQMPLVFAVPGSVVITYGEKESVSNEAQGGSTGEQITYEVVKGQDVAQILDPGSPVVTILKAGQATVRATRPGNDQYLPVSAEYVVDVKWADRMAAFAQDMVDVYYGTVSAAVPELILSAGEGSVRYSITEGEQIASVDANGVLTFVDGAMGTVKIHAAVEKDDFYDVCEAICVLNVIPLPKPEVPYIAEGKSGENGWYRDDVTITSPGYLISTENLAGGEWKESLVFTEEGIHQAVIYLKDQNGFITDGIELTVKIDKSAPSGLTVEYSEYKWFDEALFGGAKPITVTFAFVEEGSGIAELEYSLDGGETYYKVSSADGVYSASVAPEYRGNVMFRVKDIAGWISQVYTDGSQLVVDSIAPGFSVAYSGTYRQTTEGIYTAEESFGISFMVKDENADLLVEPVVTVNDVDAALEWTQVEGGLSAELVLTEEETYNIKITYSDRSNTNEETLTVHVDRTQPDLMANRVTEPVRNLDGCDIFGSNDVTLRISVKHRLFRAGNANAKVTVNGEPYEGFRIGSWNYDNKNKVYYADVKLGNRAPDGYYEICTEYSIWDWGSGDYVKNYSVPYSFMVDTTAPEIQIDYDENLSWNFIERIRAWMGFAAQTVEVKFIVSDETSGINRLVYDIGNNETVTVPAEELTQGEYVIWIDPEYRNAVSAEVYDMAGQFRTLSGENSFVLDTTPAVINVGYRGIVETTSESGKTVYITSDENFRVIFQINEENYDVRKQDPKVMIRPEGGDEWAEANEENLSWSEDRTQVLVDLPDDSEYEIKCVFEDWLYTAEAMVTVRADWTPPTIESVYQPAAVTKDNVRYFHDGHRVEIIVTEKNFSAQNVNLKVTYKPTLDGEEVELTEYAQIAQQETNWIKGMWSHAHILSLPFTDEGHYTINITSKDKIGTNASNTVNEAFVVDMHDPTDLEIVYEKEPLWVEILQQFFGFFDESVKVTLKAADAVTGIDQIQVSTDGKNFTEVEPVDGVYTYVIDAEYRDQLTLKAIDGAMRSATLADRGAIIVDTIAPDIDVQLSSAYREYDGIYYSNLEEFNVGFTVSDANYDLREKDAVVWINGTQQELSWTEDQLVDGTPCGLTDIVLNDVGQYMLSAEFTDRTNHKDSWEQMVVLDRTKPVVTVEFVDGKRQNEEDGNYYQTAQSMIIRVEELNFLAENVELRVYDGEDLLEDYTEAARNALNWKSEEDLHTLVLNFDQEKEYRVELDVTDKAGNSMEQRYQTVFTVDTTKPLVERISYRENAFVKMLETLSFGFFKAPVTASVQVSDNLSGVKSVNYSLTGTKGRNNETEVTLEGSATLDDNGEWSFKVEQSFVGSIKVWATDFANNTSTSADVGYAEGLPVDVIVVDPDAPTGRLDMSPVRIVSEQDMKDVYEGLNEDLEAVLYFQDSARIGIVVEEDNFFSENYEVKVNGDAYAVTWASEGTVHRAYVELNEDGDYLITVEGRDYSGNEMTSCASQRIVVDGTAPEINVSYSIAKDEPDAGKEDVTAKITQAEKTAALDRAVTAHITIKEENFRADDVMILVTAVNSAQENILQLDDNGFVKLYSDQGRKQNEGQENASDKWSAFEQGTWRRTDDTYEIDLIFNLDATYTFQVAYEDLAKNTAETVRNSFIVDNEDPAIIVEGVYDGEYSNSLVKNITLKIQEDNFEAERVEFTCVAFNAKGEPVAFVLPELAWEPDAAMEVWTAKLPLSVEANYTMTLAYTDASGRVGKVQGSNETVYRAKFAIDRTAPVCEQIVCSAAVDTHMGIRYYKEPVVITLSAYDETSGKMVFRIPVMKDQVYQAATSYAVPQLIEVSCETNLIALNQQLEDQGCGIRILSRIYDGARMELVLSISEEFRGSLDMAATDWAANENNTVDAVSVVVDSCTPEFAVSLPEPDRVEQNVLYFNDETVPVKFQLKEANFIMEDAVFTVNNERIPLNWTTEDHETYTAEYNGLSGEGDYVLVLAYADRSGNEMQTYTSQKIVIDRTAPVIQVQYIDGNEKVGVYDGRAYFNAGRVAKITINEHNFLADDVALSVEHVDVNGAAAGGAVVGEWNSVGDVHELIVRYDADANYTFDIAYADLATNSAADYAADQFTVDQTNPVNLEITYSQSVLDTVLNKVTFGFYDAPVTVTMRAVDMTAGVDHFIYSYVKNTGSSSVNSGKSDQTVKAKVQGETATASFVIPQSELVKGTQFNGKVTVTAVDRSENKTTVADNEVIVVDNIAPNSEVSYNEPVQAVNGTAYYAGDIRAAIRINEANFYSSDVSVKVTRDGVNYPVKVDWRDDSVDVHTGTFTLSQEGDYIVTVSYADKSGNGMRQYVSGKMVIDRAMPTIHVSNVKANSANDDEVYSFDITVHDEDGNLRPSDVDVQLQAVVRDENGRHTLQKINLGEPKVVAAGRTYVYTVTNLTEDAIYTLQGKATDLAGNATNVIVLDDGQSYEEVRFSINRKGSVFTYGSEYTENLATQYYVKNVDSNVLIHEINVDEIHNYTVKVNGVEITEETGLRTTQTGGDNQWYLREYAIDAGIFAQEGEYQIVVSSVDATEKTAYSDLKNLKMNFVVDRAAPTVVIGGLERNGRYRGEEQTVTIIPSDEGGSLAAVKVVVYPDNANIDQDEPTAVLFEMSGEELMVYLSENDGKITFKIPEGYQQTVVITSSDRAYDESGNANEFKAVIENVTVSNDALVIFIANKPLLYSTIIGALSLIFFLFFKRKKKEEEAQ